MKKTPIIRILCMLSAVLIVATAPSAVAHRLSHESTGAEAAPLVAGPGLATTQPTPPASATEQTPTIPPAATPAAPPKPASPPPAATTIANTTDLQRRLHDLGYWVGELGGTDGLLTQQAVTAFQKIQGLTPDGVAGPATRAALAVAKRPTSTSTNGSLIEIDKSRQVLFIIRDGAVAWALNTSTGSGNQYQQSGKAEVANTPPGHFSVARAVNGVDKGPLGALYRPRYFNAGIAVHGYQSVPAYPASHGCVRVTNAAMDWIWANNLMPIGSAVWVH